ncbi:helix-hairpin-helix domain-containing protein [Serpentinicella alkaliphila]|uniref:Competence protein ComEA n=1 Tax=Serpentinicella alkaliphila TaxID=1734049 RepID=A0A4R2TVF7_9FIRM|nr:helix-hairpin-helix domain-containing protein [Serpentinicella alkaliphila]QUH26748.1 helix-hairpin-helix domain-containing protein [Serpentinicella alkaliphila]TCQ07968.1 competence protein ComEA [Serpentinicella alkaliphila]
MKVSLKQKQVIIMFLVIIVISVFIKGYLNEKKKIYILSTAVNQEIKKDVNDLESKSIAKQTIFVHIEGSVKNPGLYELDADSRMNDVVHAAGGLMDNADRKRINLAKRLVDEDFIYILAIGEELEDIESSVSSNNSKGSININSASKQELESLVGIGPALADRIINYRNEKGKFNSIEELKNVNGIGEKKFNDIKGSITAK